MDMNEVFQEFVTRALREELGLSERTFRADREKSEVFLDERGKGRVKARPVMVGRPHLQVRR